MKKVFVGALVFVLCFMYAPTTQAQEQGGEGYTAKYMYLDLGVGLPRYGYNSYWNYYNGYDYYKLPNLRANLEYGFSDMFSGGLFAGYSHYGWRHTFDNGVKINERYSHLALGFRFTWHIWNFLNHKLNFGLGAEELDIYVDAMAGAVINTHYNKGINAAANSRSTSPFFGPTVGAKYYFIKNMAVFLEAGYGSGSYGVLGITFKM